MTHCLTHHITHCLTHRITHPITKLDCMTYQDLSICTEEAKQSSYTISHTVASAEHSVDDHADKRNSNMRKRRYPIR